MKKIPLNKHDILKLIHIEGNPLMNGDFFELEESYALVPEWRDDISTDRDILEEILSIVGWEKIPSLPVVGNIQKLNNNEAILGIEKIKEF